MSTMRWEVRQTGEGRFQAVEREVGRRDDGSKVNRGTGRQVDGSLDAVRKTLKGFGLKPVLSVVPDAYEVWAENGPGPRGGRSRLR